MKTKSVIILLSILFNGIISLESLCQTITINDATWTSQVDIDCDSYTSSRTLNLNITSNTTLFFGLKIKYTINNGSITYTYIQTSILLNSGTYTYQIRALEQQPMESFLIISMISLYK